MISLTFYSLCYLLWIFYVNISTLITLTLFNYIIVQLIYTQSFRYKLIYFYVMLLAVSVWSFYYSLEGFIFILLLAELLIVMLFSLIYLTLQFFTTKFSKNLNFLSLAIILIVYIYIGEATTFSIYFIDNINYYFNIQKIVSDDFFIFFYFFFVNIPVSIYLLGVTLTLFSIFFIMFYFSCKNFKLHTIKKKKTILLLRKQNLFHQANTKTVYSTFQQ